MFVTAVCFLFLLKLKWPKNKNIYDVTDNDSRDRWQYLANQMSLAIADTFFVAS